MEREKKYRLDTAENKDFMKEIRENLLEFGRQFPSPQGSSYYLGDDGSPWKDRPRETWITCRMIHVYSIGAMLQNDAGLFSLAEAGFKGLTGELKDNAHGGWYAGVKPDQTPLPLKQCYAHAFVILAASSFLLAAGKTALSSTERESLTREAEKLLADALQIYDEKFWNEKEGLARDTWNTEFTLLDDYRGVNANMHTVEAFLAVADAVSREEYRVRAGRVIDHVIEWAKENQWRIPEHYTKEWIPDLECNKEKPDDPFKPYGATPGHGIEWARLVVQWAVSTFGEEAAKNGNYLKAAEELYNRAVTDGWNCDGAEGIVYTTGWDGRAVVHDRMHWTLAEAINTSAVLYRMTGSEKYAKDYEAFMKYLDEKVLDHGKGSWFHQLDENNRLKGTVWPGKSDLYHAFQATLIPYNGEIGRSIATACAERELK